MIIIINNRKYDITEFIKQHPGGSEVFKDGKDMTKEFYEVGHSKRAEEMLKEYLIKEDDVKEDTKIEDKIEEEESEKVNIDNISIIDILLHKFKGTKISKLFTHEDKANIHKILGAAALINYGYFFYDIWSGGCKGMMSLRKKDVNLIFSIIPLMILSASALIFKTPTKVHHFNSMPEEYQYHSVLFAFRSFIIIIILLLFGKNKFTNMIIVGILFLNMKMADIISENFKDPEQNMGSKVNNIPFWSECPVYMRSFIKKIYSVAQLTFTGWAFNTSIETHMAAGFVIQVTALLFTLRRKQIISIKGWHMLYLLQYLLIILSWIREPRLFIQLGIGILCYIVRANMRINKYTLWSVYGIIYMFFQYGKKDLGSVIQHLVLLMIILMIANSKDMIFDKRSRRVDNSIVIENKKQKENHNISIKLAKDCEFYPGQYFNLYINREKRPYTPIKKTGQRLDFLIKDYNGGEISPKICKHYSVGGDVNILGPYGKKYYDPVKDMLIINGEEIKTKNIVMFCCGTGITPFYSILTNLSKDTRYKFKIYASFKSVENAFLINDISNKIAKKRCFYSKENNKLTGGKVSEIINKNKKSTILVCGTDGYNNMIKKNVGERKLYCW